MPLEKTDKFFDGRRYKQNGILNMLERNMLIKRAPERWQETTKHFDIVITFDQRVYDMVVEGTFTLSIFSLHY
jgi:hypothetical protein